MKLLTHIEQKSILILHENEFNKEGKYQGNKVDYANVEPIVHSAEKIAGAIAKCKDECDYPAEIKDNPVLYEKPDSSVNISIDDVNVKKQEENRIAGGNNEKRKRKYVHNTVVHIGKEGFSYLLNGYGIKSVLSYVIAFILFNDLDGKRLQFFTDGHKILNDTILKYFLWNKNIGIILDWFHLKKKCKEQLSMALKGRVIRNQILKKLMPLLWFGLVDRAISLLNKIDNSSIKDTDKIEKLIAYFERNKSIIPCYAVRKELGLCNSSAIGEKMNDLVVSERQKNNGMSWSKEGSVALATITSLKRNKEYKQWFEKKEIEFKMVA